MRLGVSGKIFLAYTVLLLAFTANATFTLVVIHRARQGVVANEAYLDLQGSVDAAWKSLRDTSEANGPLVGKVESTFVIPTDFSPLK